MQSATTGSEHGGRTHQATARGVGQAVTRCSVETRCRVVMLARLSQRGTLRRVDALEGMSFCSELRWFVGAGMSLRIQSRNCKRVAWKV